jgi:hypothetical protein
MMPILDFLRDPPFLRSLWLRLRCAILGKIDQKQQEPFRNRVFPSNDCVCETCSDLGLGPLDKSNLGTGLLSPGICGHCNRSAPVWDYMLLALYKSWGIADQDLIRSELPLQRHNMLSSGSKELSRFEIEMLIKKALAKQDPLQEAAWAGRMGRC